ncbi:hypothetical protein [Fusobacterium sp.]|nr:hypothetical protein [Fusobacterium sp.]
MANKSNYFPRRRSHFKNYRVILSGRGSQIYDIIMEKVIDRGYIDEKI